MGALVHAENVRPSQTNEQRAAQRLEELRTSPPALRAFLSTFPKGGELHTHLSGAVYAETLLRNAAEDLLCVDTAKLAFVANTGTTKSLPAKPVCTEGSEPASNAFVDPKLYRALINALSMRSFVPTSEASGHDHFFATFARYKRIHSEHNGEWVDEIATRAAAQNEQYLEVLFTPDFSVAVKLAAENHWNGDPAAMRQALLGAGLRSNIAIDRAELDAVELRRNALEHCGTPDATAACGVKIRYLFQVLRGASPEQVFAQTLLGFELASVDPRVVGINFVQPEDGYLAMRGYATQMTMLRYLRTEYPNVHLSLHAGELTPGLVPPEGLLSHIRQAVEVAGADRIGHGVDIAGETGSAELLRTMHDRHIAVEINLSSNDAILGVFGANHPLSLYRAAHVPFTLSTDDEGVSRIDLTGEYVRAVVDQHLDYADLKHSARTALGHSFLPGENLFVVPDDATHLSHGCVRPSTANTVPSKPCAEFLLSSEKATEQYELERRFLAFESATQTR